MTLPGCKHSEQAAASAEAARARVSPAGECRRILSGVRVPGYREGQDARAVIAHYQANLDLANAQIAQGRACADTAVDRAQ